MANSLASGQKPTGVADLDSEQELKEKTLDSSCAINGAPVTGSNIINPTRLDVKKDELSKLQDYVSSQGEFAGNLPPSNGQLCFATDAKKMYQVLDGALAEVGSGQGGINYISNPDFELNAEGYTGDTNLTITRSTEEEDRLRGSASGIISKAAVDASGEVVKIPFTIESADLAKKLYISFDKDASDANYADADLRVEVIKDPNGTPVTIRCNAEDILGGKGSHLAWFQTDASILEYELVFKCNSSNASAYSVKIDNVSVGPREVSYGSAMTDWKDFPSVAAGTLITGSTTNPTYGTVAFNSAKYRRVGCNMEITWNYKQTTTGSAGSGFLYFNLPSGYEIDLDQVNSSAAANAQTSASDSVGSLTLQNGSANGWENIIASAKVLDSNTLWFMGFSEMDDNGTTGTAPSDPISLTGNVAFSNTVVQASMTVSVPIKGWSSNSIQSEDIGNREVFASATRTTNQSIPSNTQTDIIFDSVLNDYTNSYNNTTGIFTAPEKGLYSISGHVLWNEIATAIGSVRTDLLVNGAPKRRFYAGAKDGGDVVANGNSIAATLELQKGDQVKLQAFTNAANDILGSEFFTHISFVKLASPQTILETETVAARYTSSNGQAIDSDTDIVYEEKVFDTHNAYSGGIYTTPVTGYYQINAKIRTVSFACSSGERPMFLRVKVNGTVVDWGSPVDNNTSAITKSYAPSNATLIYLEKGDEVIINQFNSLTGGSNLEATSGYNTFSIARIK